MTATKEDSLARQQAEEMAKAVDLIIQMIRDETENKKDVIYGASTIIAMHSGELMDRLGFPHETVADVQIRTDLAGDASIVITWKKPEEDE